MSVRLLVLLTLAALAVFAAVIFWQAILGALFTVYALRRVARRNGLSQAGRRRPRSSWARNVQAGSAAFAAWQARRLLRPAPLERLNPVLLPVGVQTTVVKPPTRRVAS